VLEDCWHRYSVGIILTPATADSAIARRSSCRILMKDHSDSLVLIVLRIVLRTVLKSEYDHPGDRPHGLSKRVRKIDLDSNLTDSIVDDSLDYFE